MRAAIEKLVGMKKITKGAKMRETKISDRGERRVVN